MHKLDTYTGVLQEGLQGQRKVEKIRATFWDSKLIENLSITLTISKIL